MGRSGFISASLGNVSVKRRTFLKAMGASGLLLSTAACSKGDEDEVILLSEREDDLVFDKETKMYFSTGPHNCGMRCVHKLHVKNGRVMKMTSDGDIPRGGGI